MKNLTKTLLLSLFAIVAITFNGCKENSTDNPANSYDLLTMSIPYVTQAADGMTEATMDTPMMFPPNSGDNKGGEMGNPMARPNELYLGRILRELNLTDDQKAQVKEFLAQYKDCISQYMKIIQEERRNVMEQYNQQRKDIIEQVKAGTLTRKEAATQLADINKQARAALQNDDIIKAALEAIKKCREDLLTNIGSILTEEQLTKWQAFLEKIRQKP